MILSFNLPDRAISLSTSRSYAKVFGEIASNNEWRVENWSFQNENLTSIPKKGEMKVNLFYRGPGEGITSNSISSKIAGDLRVSTFETNGTIKVICP